MSNLVYAGANLQCTGGGTATGATKTSGPEPPYATSFSSPPGPG